MRYVRLWLASISVLQTTYNQALQAQKEHLFRKRAKAEAALIATHHNSLQTISTRVQALSGELKAVKALHLQTMSEAEGVVAAAVRTAAAAGQEQSRKLKEALTLTTSKLQNAEADLTAAQQQIVQV
jgi:hypothetical protein